MELSSIMSLGNPLIASSDIALFILLKFRCPSF
jgi:hypothetical protein